MEIQLTQGKVAQIDHEDWPLVAPYKWYAAKSTDGRWYAHAAPLDGYRARTKVRMHTLIPGRRWVDHVDEDGLNNRRLNLRPCTNAHKQQNTGSRGGSSRFKGVSWNARHGRWLAQFRCDGKYHFVGWFDEEEEAARAYDAAILPVTGEFARLNFPVAA